MSILDVFSKNLTALMDANPALNSQYKLGAAASIAPTNIGRFKRGDGAAQIDSVEQVAKAFRLRACDILDPELVKRLEAGEPLRMSEPKPPGMTDDDWKALSPRARAFVEELCAAALAGRIQDTDIGWLHDSLQRVARPG